MGTKIGTDGTFGGWPNLTSELLFRVPRSSFAWAGMFSCHRNLSLRGLSLLDAMGTQTLSGIGAVVFRDL
jgi:hypothetical protein